MADYYPLLARALDALPNSSPAMRKAVYDRARNALTAQLRSLDPPVAEADIGVELTALDSAIKRLEGEFGAAAPEPIAAPLPPKPAPPKSAPPPPVPEPAPPVAEPAPLPEPAPMPVAIPFSTQPVAETTPAPAPASPPAEKVRPPEAAPPTPDAKSDQKAKTEFVAFVPPPRKRSASSSSVAAEREAPAVPEASNTNAASDVSLPPSIDNGAARRPKIEVVAPRPSKSRALRNVFVGGMLALVIGAIAVAAFLLRDEPSSLSQDADGDGQAQVDPAEQKFADRVDGSSEGGRVPNSVAPPPEVTVAQRGILYEENASNPQAEPRTTAGRVVWRLEPVNGEQGQPLQNAVRMTAEFSEIGVQLRMMLRKNLDATLPASHTIELDFTMSGPSASQVVQDIGLLQLKDDQNARGSTISGLPVRVRDNLFLIGMSNLPSDMDRNRELLLNKAWIDLGFKFRSGQRGVIAVEKGASGSQALRAAFDLWRD